MIWRYLVYFQTIPSITPPTQCVGGWKFLQRTYFYRLNSKILEFIGKKSQLYQFQMFLVINACTVLFMQCGFALLEAGAVRAKNVTNILIKNLLDACKYKIIHFSRHRERWRRRVINNMKFRSWLPYLLHLRFCICIWTSCI